MQGAKSEAPLSRIDQFAELLSEHQATGRGKHPGGSVPEVAKRMGIYSGDANSLLQRIRKRLGPQAR